MKHFISVFIFSFLFKIAFSQSITITGKVIDAHAQEPLSFCSIGLMGTGTGTLTDDNGNYTITFKVAADSIVFSTVGYNTVTLPITKQPNQTINAELYRANFMLVDITIHAGEDPAVLMFRHIQKNKNSNNKDKLQSYQYEVYNKLEVDVDKINDKFKKNVLLKPFGFVYKYMDSTSEEKPYLPMYLTESLSDFYYRKSPQAKKEIIKASRLAGGSNESISQFLGTMYQDVNVYDNRMSLLGVDFISPIAAGGLFYYKYRITDTAVLDGRRCYKITFNPKHEGQNAFIGDMWVNDTTWAVKRISMTMAKGSNINYISRMSLYQDYQPVTDSVWLCKKDKFIVDFISPKKSSPGLIGRKTTSYKKIIANNPMIDTVFKDKQDIITQTNAINRNEDYWNTVRHDSLSKNEKNIYKLVDTIQQVPAFKHYSQLLTTLGSGYYAHGKIEFGPWYYLYALNHREGHRVGLGLETTNEWSTKFLISGFGAYGFKDETFKFDFKGIYIPFKNPRLEFRTRYLKDIITYNQLPDELGENNIFSAFTRRVPNSYAKLMGNEEFQFSVLKEWLQGWSEKVGYTQSQLRPFFDLKNRHTDKSYNGPYPTYYNAEITLTSRFAYHEKFISGQFLRSSVGSDYPIVSLDLKQGLKGVSGSSYDYQKIKLQVDDNFRTGFVGSFYYSIIAEKIINKTPMPIFLLGVAPGNDTYYYDKYAFNNMNRYEFIADQYLSVRVSEYLGGFPLNYIPAIKKLKWRTFVGGKALWGSMTAANKLYNGYDDNADAKGIINPFEIPTKVPYTEVGTGIENIFKVLRIDFVWRTTYFDKQKYPDTSPFGIKASMQVEF